MMWRWSRTDASRGQPTASWSAMSRRRPRAAAPSPFLQDGDRVTIDVERQRIDTDADLETRAKAGFYNHQNRAIRQARSPNMPLWWVSASQGAVTSFPFSD